MIGTEKGIVTEMMRKIKEAVNVKEDPGAENVRDPEIEITEIGRDRLVRGEAVLVTGIDVDKGNYLIR